MYSAKSKEDFLNYYLHGYCTDFALALSTVFHYPIEVVVEIGTTQNLLVHAYCINADKDQLQFIDVRGVYTDYDAFLEEFTGQEFETDVELQASNITSCTIDQELDDGFYCENFQSVDDFKVFLGSLSIPINFDIALEDYILYNRCMYT